MIDARDTQSEPWILLLEEDAETRRLLSRALRRQGFRVRSACSERSAVELLGRCLERPGVILADLPAVEEQALATARRVRSRSGCEAEVTVVVIADPYRPEREGTEVWHGPEGVVIYMETFEQLCRLLAAVLGRRPADCDIRHASVK